MKTVAITKARSNLYKLIDEVIQSGEPAIVTKYRKPIVKIIPYLSLASLQDNPLKNSILFEKNIVDPI